MEKKRRLISMDKLPVEIQGEFQKRYPHGYRRFIQKITNHKSETFHCVPVETDDSLWLVKINLKQNNVDVRPSFPDFDDDDDNDDVMGADDSDIEVPDDSDD